MSLLTILLIVLVCAILFGGWGHNQGWGPVGWSPVGLVVVVLLALVLTGRVRLAVARDGPRPYDDPMANYHENCVREQTDPWETAVGTGDTPSGEERICVCLAGDPINAHLLEDETGHWEKQQWTSLSMKAARSLWRQLDGLKHLWEKEGPDPYPGS